MAESGKSLVSVNSHPMKPTPADVRPHKSAAHLQRLSYPSLLEEDVFKTSGPSPETQAWLPSFLFWSWITALINFGYKKPLQAEDLYDLNERESTRYCADRWNRAWKEGKEDTANGPSVLRCLLRSFQLEFWSAACWKPLWFVAVVLQVYILKALVKVASDKGPLKWWWGALLVVGMLLSSVVQSLSQGHNILKCQKVGMKVRAAVCVAVYKKMLARNMAATGSGATQGRMLNLITNDTQKLLDAVTLFHFVWHPVIELTVICILAIVEAGVSALGGVLVVLLIQPVQLWMAKRVGSVRRIAVQYTDARVRLVSEVLSGVRVVKYNGWTPAFLKRLEELRSNELKWIRRASYVRSGNSTLKDTVTPLASLATFGIYTAIHRERIQPAMAFTVLALFSIMVRIFTITPQALQYLGEAIVALRRLQTFFQLPDGNGNCPAEEAAKARELHGTAALAMCKGSFAWPAPSGPTVITDAPAKRKQPRRKGRGKKEDSGILEPWMEGRSHISFRHGASAGKEVEVSATTKKTNRTAGTLMETDDKINTRSEAAEEGERMDGDWQEEVQGFRLQDIDLEVGREEIVAVTGVVGSGKSSLLLALLSEMEYKGGGFFLDGAVAYVPQQAWILNDTVVKNITFGSPYVPSRYREVVAACALEQDIAQFPAGHGTEIGERGVNLSGGQKARISLARACYSSAPIVLLDDPLAAVDVPTARHLMDHVLAGALAGRAVVLVTHTRRSLAYCSRVVVMKNGRLRSASSTSNLTILADELEDSGPPEVGWEKNRVEEVMETRDVRQQEEEDVGNWEEVSVDGEKDRGKDEEGREGGPEDHREDQKKREQDGGGKLTVLEDRVEGKVAGGTFGAYIMAGGGVVAFILLIAFFMFAQSLRTFVDYWLGVWVDDKYSLPAGVYVGIFAAFTVAAGVMSLLRALLYTVMTVRSARHMHHDMAVQVLRSPQIFFDQNPVGRIVNRFSKDQALVDELLPTTAQVMLELYLAVLGSLVIIGVLIPWVLLILPPVALVFYWLQKRYVKVSRELKRLDGLSRSPIYAHFAETLSGISSVRGYGVSERYLQHYMSLIDANHRAYILFAHAGRWLGVRLDTCAAFIVAAVALCVVLLRTSLPPGMAGVVLVQSLQLIGLFSYATRQAAETENYFTSVERIHAYTQLPTEAEAHTPEGIISEHWPERGEIVVEHFTMAYRVDLPPVLNDINFQVEAQEKVGILGRTGAGKSSLAAALFRMVENEACKGRILIDGVDIRSVGLDDLRQRLSIIPQDPVLFNGSVRQNLDPFGLASDAAIHEALERVHLDAKMESLDSGLDSQVSENGDNLSVGQRQLLCLARALLRRSRVIVMDEATAAVDGETDQLIQATMRTVFRDCTVLTIAHRIDTVIDCDRVVVLANGGQIAEFDTPANLLRRAAGPEAEHMSSGIFASMVAQTGPETAEMLRRTAEEAEQMRARKIA